MQSDQNALQLQRTDRYSYYLKNYVPFVFLVTVYVDVCDFELALDQADLGLEDNCNKDFIESFLAVHSREELSALNQDSADQLLAKYAFGFHQSALKSVLEKLGESLMIQSELKPIEIKDPQFSNDFTTQIGFIFQSSASLPALDHVFLHLSELLPVENFSGRIYVSDLSSLLHQGYEAGEYDTGSLTNPDDEEDYYETITSHVDNLYDMQGEKIENVIASSHLDVGNIPITQIFSECLLRYKNNYFQIDGIDVVFDRYCITDEDGEEKENFDEESLDIQVQINEDLHYHYGILQNCSTLPTINKEVIDHLDDTYSYRVKDYLVNSGMTLTEYEDYIRQYFKETYFRYWLRIGFDPMEKRVRTTR